MRVQTDIGLLPEDWEIVCIGDLGKVITGSTPPTADTLNYGYDIMFVSPADLGDSKYVNKTIKYLSKKGFEISRQLPKGSILYTCIGSTIGKIGIAGERLATNQQINAIIPNKKYNSEYLYYALILRKNHIIGDASVQAVPLINKNDFSEKSIFVPLDKPEQKRIAEALSSIDKLINNLSRTIAKKENMRDGAMEELLSGKRRLPGFTKPWEEKKISEIGKLTGAGVDKKINPNEVPVRLVNYLDVYRRKRIANSELHHWVTASPDKVASCNVKRGDVFFTPSSEMPDDIGQSAVAVEDMENVCYSYHIYRLRPKPNLLDDSYGAYAFQTKFFFEQVNIHSDGSGKRYVVALTKFRELSVMLPTDLDEQRAIADTLTAMDDEIQVMKIEKEKYEQIRSGMMDDLLSGKIRLK